MIETEIEPHRRASSLATLASVVLAMPVAIVMGAVAEALIALVAIPVGYVVSRDLYVALLSPSFGALAAASVVQWLMLAALLWSALWPLIAGRRVGALAAGGGGAATAMLALVVTPLLARHVLAQHVTLIGSNVPGIALALAGGALGGVTCERWIARRASIATLSRWRADLVGALGAVAIFTLALALVAESVVALLVALGAM